MALLTPPGQVPDEPAHMARAAGLLRGEILGHRQIVINSATGKSFLSAGLDVNAALMQASFGQMTSLNGHPKFTAADSLAEASIPQNGTMIFSMSPNTVRGFPAFYLPAALGLEIGLLAHLSPYYCFRLARLAMLTGFLCMGAAALQFAAFGESLILAVLLLPMSLFLASSLNMDGELIGASCLAGALLTRNPTAANRWQPAAALILMLIACAKPPYIPLLGCLLPPLVRPGLSRRIIYIALAAIPVFLWCILIAKTVIVPLDQIPYHPGSLWHGDRSIILNATNPAGNLQILLSQPLRFLILPLHSLWVLGHQNIHEAIGILGLLAITLPPWFYRLWEVAIVLAITGATATIKPGALIWRPRDALWVSLMLMATIFGIELSTYLSWTKLGDPVIDGVTGRYFLPLLPFLPLILPRLPPTQISRIHLLRFAGTCPIIILSIFDSIYLPLKLANYY